MTATTRRSAGGGSSVPGRYPGAVWRPIPRNFTPGGMGQVLGGVAHMMQGTLDGSFGWFCRIPVWPDLGSSSHFGVGRAGRVEQYVDCNDKAWAQAGGNPSYVSIEFEGSYGDALTGAQITAAAGIMCWLASTRGVALTLAAIPGDRGLGYHAMGGIAWGGHPDCPGPIVVAQRSLVLASVSQGKVAPMFNPPIVLAAARACPSGGVWGVGPDGSTYALGGAPVIYGCNGQGYFGGRVAADLVHDARGVCVVNSLGGPTILDTANETYAVGLRDD